MHTHSYYHCVCCFLSIECNCDTVGAVDQDSCMEYGGQCHCKSLFNIDKKCDVCAAGSYIDSTDPDGCAG